MIDPAATLFMLFATPVSAASNPLHAGIDPLALFLLGGAGVLFAALCYGICSSWNDEMVLNLDGQDAAEGSTSLVSATDAGAASQSHADTSGSRAESAVDATPVDSRRPAGLVS